MNDIKRWFKDDYENYEITEYDGHLEAKTNTVLYMIVSPHSGTNNRWMLRVSTIAAFDKWANSTAVEEFFETEVELCIYLYDHQLEIHKDLLKYLSLEYEDAIEILGDKEYDCLF